MERRAPSRRAWVAFALNVRTSVPPEFVKLANDKLAAINAAYEKIQAERGLK